MKITYHTTGFFKESIYLSGLLPFLKQYKERFPGVEYLHLELHELPSEPVKAGAGEQFYYSSNERMLKIDLAKWTCNNKPTPFEIYIELRNVFDFAVEEHLKNHQRYVRYAPLPINNY